MPDSADKIKTAISEIFVENNKQALTIEELTKLAARKFTNGEVDDELIEIVIGEMIESTELMQQHDGKVAPYQFP